MLLRVFYCEKHVWYINVWYIMYGILINICYILKLLIFKTRVNIFWIGYCHGKSLLLYAIFFFVSSFIYY